VVVGSGGEDSLISFPRPVAVGGIANDSADDGPLMVKLKDMKIMLAFHTLA
jgi:hypothetical protein